MREEGNGLTSEEARKRLSKFGSNVLPEKPPPTNLEILISQFKSPLVYVLVIAGSVTLVLKHLADTIIVFSDVFINTILGFVQEKRANNALTALKKLVHPHASVVRDGKQQKIAVEEIVPGDICVVGSGDKVPADGSLVFTNRLFVNESILTGESIPVSKKEKDPIKMGTIVTSGQGHMAVEVTGAKTSIGKIATSIQGFSEDTPLRRQLTKFSKQLSVLVLILTIAVFVIGVISGKSLTEMMITSVALAVSSIPEGLLVGLTVVLAIGMQRILKRRGLVRSLVSAETLGGVTTICVDKTGTLTAGELKVTDVIGKESDLTLQSIVANDFDDPIVVSAFDWALRARGLSGPAAQSLITNHIRLDSIPFSSKNRFFASLNRWDKTHNMIFVNGAPEFLMKWSEMGESEKLKVKDEIEKLTREGKRVVGMARNKVKASQSKLFEKDIEGGLEWIGLLAFTDPVRVGVREALEKTKKAGIKLIVITGDYPQTAISVMKILGVDVEETSFVLGQDLEKLTSKELAKLLKTRKIVLFARTSPDQKNKIVDALQENGEVVAMMGDGVNDAPALAAADIGIVVGDATDVAKETADLVLMDSNFATIVAAVEEGRGIFDNIRKIILYLMSDGFEEIIAVVGSMILRLPLPVTAAQILWINIVSDGFPDLALTLDPKVKGIMAKPPRSPKENLVAPWMRELILIVSAVGGILALFVFIYFYKTENLELARSITFATLGVNSLIYVFSIRTLRDPFWEENPFDNKWLNLSVIGGLIFQTAPFVWKPLGDFFGIVPITVYHWLVVFGVAVVLFVTIEISKVLFRKQLET